MAGLENLRMSIEQYKPKVISGGAVDIENSVGKIKVRILGVKSKLKHQVMG